MSKLWANTVVFITWDDWGGWYDHVNAPLKETWKGGGPSPAYTNSQFSYGPRVGCLVLSPYAKKGYISKTLHSHVSLVKFCEMTFGLKPLNARDSASDDMSDCFNFKQTPLAPPAWSGSGKFDYDLLNSLAANTKVNLLSSKASMSKNHSARSRALRDGSASTGRVFVGG